MFRQELKVIPCFFSGCHLFCIMFRYCRMLAGKCTCYSSCVSLGTMRQSFSSKTSAEVGSGDRMHLKMMARWWHSKRPSFEGLYTSIRNIPCSICISQRLRHIHSSHRTTTSQNTRQLSIYYQIQKEFVILTLSPLMRKMSLHKSAFYFPPSYQILQTADN